MPKNKAITDAKKLTIILKKMTIILPKRAKKKKRKIKFKDPSTTPKRAKRVA